MTTVPSKYVVVTKPILFCPRTRFVFVSVEFPSRGGVVQLIRTCVVWSVLLLLAGSTSNIRSMWWGFWTLKNEQNRFSIMGCLEVRVLPTRTIEIIGFLMRSIFYPTNLIQVFLFFKFWCLVFSHHTGRLYTSKISLRGRLTLQVLVEFFFSPVR